MLERYDTIPLNSDPIRQYGLRIYGRANNAEKAVELILSGFDGDHWGYPVFVNIERPSEQEGDWLEESDAYFRAAYYRRRRKGGKMALEGVREWAIQCCRWADGRE